MRRGLHFVVLAGIASNAAASEAARSVAAPPTRPAAVSSSTNAVKPFVPAATCCDPTPLVVRRNDSPLAKWVLAEESLGDVAPLEPRVANVTFSVEPSVAEIPRRSAAVEAALARWSESSQSLEPMCSARARRLSRAMQGEHTGHEIEWVTLFQGPVEVEDLDALLTWESVRETANGSVLSAVPRDSTERLFVPRLEVTLDENGVPKDVRFFNRADAPRPAVALSNIRVLPGRTVQPRVRHVAARFVTDDANLIRTAEFTVEEAAPAVVSPLLRVVHEVPSVPAKDDPRLVRILSEWSTASARLPARVLEFQEFRYDLVFHTESRRTGRATFAADGSVTFRLEPAEIDGKSTKRVDAVTGKPFALRSGSAQSIHWDAARLRTPKRDATGPNALLLAAAFPEGFLRPEDLLPTSRPVSAAELRRRYAVELKNFDDREIRLRLVPKLRIDSCSIRESEVILSTSTMQLTAVRHLDASGNVETVWTVERTSPLDATTPDER